MENDKKLYNFSKGAYESIKNAPTTIDKALYEKAYREIEQTGAEYQETEGVGDKSNTMKEALDILDRIIGKP